MKSPKKHNNKTPKHSVQIIGGTHRHRKIDFYAVDDLRPTGARLRETLFNWLQPMIYDSTCLDLFAGSGILGFEALSRGAKSVTFVEKNQLAAKQLQCSAKNLQLSTAHIIQADFRDALQQLKQQAQPVDIVFLDPPYTLRLLPELLDSIKSLQPTWLFIEDDKPLAPWVAERGDYRLHKDKKAGNIYYGLLVPHEA